MKLFISFGQVHCHSINGKTFDKNCIAEIECNDYKHGREKAFEYFGDKFAFDYLEKELNEKVMSYFPRGIIKVEAQDEM